MSEQSEREELERLERRELEELEARAAAANSQPQENARTFLNKEQELQRKLADYLGRGMDYLGGGVRTGAGYLTGVGKEGDISRALHGQAPSSSELLKRHGLEDNIGTSAAGFALDTLSDPLSYGSLASKLAEKLGKKIYTMGSIGRIDEASKMAGQLPISPVLWEHGISGSNPEILKKSEQLVNDLLTKRKQIFDEAAAKGVPADLTEIDKAIAGLREKWLAPGAANERNKASSEALSEAEKIAKEYFDPLKAKAETQVVSQGPAALGTTVSETVPAVPAGSLEQLSSNLTSFGRNELTPRVYDKTKPTSNELEQALKAVRHGGKKAAEATAEKIGKGADYEKIQSELSALASGKKQLINEAKRTGNQKILGAVGGGLAGLAKSDPTKIPALMGFYGGKIAGMTYPQTKAGMAIGKSGEYLQKMYEGKSLWDKMVAIPAMQRALIDQLKEEEQPQ